VVYRDVTQQAKGLYRLKHVGALGSELAYLSRYNSGWFCHRHSVYYDFNGEDHDIIEQSENKDVPDDELDDIGMNALPIYFKYLF
jgi:hypothetical protein